MKIAFWSVMVAVTLVLPVAGQAKSPAPEFAVESIFQEHLARKFAKQCKSLVFDNDGFDRHVLNRLAQYSNRGVHSREIFKHYAPIQTHRYQRHVDRFARKHGLDMASKMDAFCEAAKVEMRGRTPIGQMLKGKDRE